jgi:FkbM family methyltransferase
MQTPEGLMLIEGYYFPDWIEHRYDYFIRHMRDSESALRYLKDRGTVVQAGGHVGLWPLSLSEHFSVVHTFEPDSTNYECLLLNNAKEIAEGRVIPHNQGVSSATGEIGLVQSTNNTGGHYLGDGDVKVELARIDDLELGDCSAIFLDVEGHELEALKGAEQVIRGFSPLLMLEIKDHVSKSGCSEKQLSDYLKHIGYIKVGSQSHDDIYIKSS